MRFGMSVPNFGPFADVERLAQLAGDAEKSGWDGFFLWDHIHWTQQPMLDLWVALAVVAGRTSRIRIGTMVTPLARRRPWKLARETVTLDHYSGGRFTLGVGLGFPPDEEFERLGENADARLRARLLDEGLEVLTGLWSGRPFTFQGEAFKIDNATFLPRPLQQPRIPIWVAGMWPARAPFRRAARWDGMFPIKVDPRTGAPQFLGPGDVAEIVAYVRRHRDSDAAFDVAVGASLPADDPSRARDTVAFFAAAGATWLIESDPNDIDWLSARVREGPVVA
jgi:alkanesulfonate monooxygenase SsuD/methylene tetrahydromethanopterin reductase-like flavin-dependent oxidoreductase (luciferase family)